MSTWPVVPDGTPQFYIDPSTSCGDSSIVSGDSPLNDGKWHHMVATYEDSSMKLYVNGVLQQETEISTYSKTNASIRIGMDRRTHNHPEWRWFYQGSIDDIRLYNRAISENEIIKIYHGSLLLAIPSVAKEGDGLLSEEGTVRIFKAPNSDLTVNLSIDDSSEISIPKTVTIDANSTSSTFPITILDDQEVDDMQIVSIKAKADTYIDGNASLQVEDNDENGGGSGGGGGGGCLINSFE